MAGFGQPEAVKENPTSGYLTPIFIFIDYARHSEGYQRFDVRGEPTGPQLDIDITNFINVIVLDGALDEHDWNTRLVVSKSFPDE